VRDDLPGAPGAPGDHRDEAPRRRRVVITGAGLVSPLGDSPAALHAALVAGSRARRPIELFPTTGLGCQEAGEIRPFEPQAYLGERNLRPLDRTSRLLVVAAQLALAESGWSPAALAEHEVGLVAGTTFCSVRTIAEFDRRSRLLGPAHASPFDFANSVINAAAGQTAIWHRLRGVNSTIAAGEASALVAIAQATELVRCGRIGAILAGGAEELCFESFFGYYRAGRLCGSRRGAAGEWPVPYEARRNGFSLSEGAALLMLEDAAAAAARGARVRAEVLGWGTSFVTCEADPGEEVEETAATGGAAPGPDGTVPEVRGAEAAATAIGASAPSAASAAIAAGVARAVRLALADAATDAAEIGCVSTSANGSRVADRAEAEGLAAALGTRGTLDILNRAAAGGDGAGGGAAGGVPVAAIKAMLGEGMGVAGAWQVIDLVETIAGGVLPGIAGLERIEPGLPLGGLSAASRRLSGASRRRVLATAVSADGHCAALVLGAPEGLS
jgi:3-oxoacyl-[acyl-carrier-protein] synthase II